MDFEILLSTFSSKTLELSHGGHKADLSRGSKNSQESWVNLFGYLRLLILPYKRKPNLALKHFMWPSDSRRTTNTLVCCFTKCWEDNTCRFMFVRGCNFSKIQNISFSYHLLWKFFLKRVISSKHTIHFVKINLSNKAWLKSWDPAFATQLLNPLPAPGSSNIDGLPWFM